MPTKAGKIQFKDLRAGKTIFVIGTEFFPAFRRVIPFLKMIQMDNEYVRTIPKPEWINLLAEGQVYASRRAAERYMRLHGKDMLRAENHRHMLDARRLSVKGPNLNSEEPIDDEGNQFVSMYSQEDIDSWMEHNEQLYDWQIESFALGLPMEVLSQGMHIKLRSYVRQKILTGQGNDIMQMTGIEDPVAQAVNKHAEGEHELPAGQGV